MKNEINDRDAAVDRLLAGTMARASAEPEGACLDADTLAAWADNTLDASGLAAAEAHAADCARCQAMLAAMVKTEPTRPDAAASRWRMPSLRWLIPLTAAAAAVILWTIVPVREMGQANVRQASQSAESTPALAAAPAATDAVAPSAGATASSRARPEQETREQFKDAEADKKTVAPPDANALADAPARSAEGRLEKAQTVAESSAAQAPRANAKEMLTVTGATPALRDSLRSIIVSSNPASRWRIVAGGAVQQTADGGSTWQTQSTGVTDTLSAGSSPSPSVCWLVGPNGIVLLSTDGRSWKRVAFPEAVPLVSVVATDDQTATVVAADGRQFVTQDGGRTWTRAPDV